MTDDGSAPAPPARASDEPKPDSRGVVVGPDESTGAELDDAPENPTELVDQPAKVMRIGTMIKQLLEEVRSAPLDEAARARLAAVHERSLRELEDGLSPELVAELHRITLPLGVDTVPSDAELRIAQAQLVGWLEGLFHGIQTALVAQQMAAQSQLAHMRRSFPPRADGTHHGPPSPRIPRPIPLAANSEVCAELGCCGVRVGGQPPSSRAGARGGGWW